MRKAVLDHKNFKYNRIPIGKSDKKSKFSIYFTLAVSALIIFSYLFIPQVASFIDHSFEVLGSNDEDRIKSWINNFSWFGPLLLILAMVLQMFLLVVPTTLLLVVCILAYGPVWGSLISLIAIFSASSVGYLLGRNLGFLTVERILGNSIRNRITLFLEKYGFWAIFITRLNPFLSNDAVSLVSGILKINYWKFIFASLTGITPLILILAVFGESAENLLYLLIGSAIVLAILCGYVFLIRKRTPKKVLEIR